MANPDLFKLATEVKALPDYFFDSYELLLDTFTEEQKEKIRSILEPEAKRRGLREAVQKVKA